MSQRPRVIQSIVAQHAEEAAFLWCQRAAFLRSARLSLPALGRHENRLAAHLDALRIAGDNGIPPCERLVRDGERGAMFAPAVAALEAKQMDRIQTFLRIAESVPTLHDGLISAFGWVSPRALQGVANELLTSGSPFDRRVAIACCAMHGVSPRQSLEAAIDDPAPRLRARGLRSAGALGVVEALRRCVAQLGDPDIDCQRWAAWSAILLGDRTKALATLAEMSTMAGAVRRRFFQLVLQAMSVGAAHLLLRQLAVDRQQRRWVIEGSGIVGDAAYVPWLIGQMSEPECARLAGEAFSLISGADIQRSNLKGSPPENFEAGPNDDPDDPNVETDPDDGLPWPDPEKVQRWWDANKSRFTPGQRYFMGAPVTREHCIQVLKNGYQRQRTLAAHYLCLLEPGTPLFNTSAPAWRQLRLLEDMK